MSDFLINWFEGFEEGIKSLDQRSKEIIFNKCSEKCIGRGGAKLYESHYVKYNRDLDQFFINLSELGHIQGKVLSSGHQYELVYSQCSCDLHKSGYIKSDSICECSRQSIIHVMKCIQPESKFEVEIISTILSGDKECRFLIRVIRKKELD